MKKIFFILISTYFVLSVNITIANTIVTDVVVKTDYEYEGAKGIFITYKYNFLPIIEETHNDTILNDCTFYLSTQLQLGTNLITPVDAYKYLKNNNGKFVVTKVLNSSDVKPTKFDKTTTQFIPYASLNLAKGEYTINILTMLKGKDATGKIIEQQLTQKDITFTKPLTKTFEMDIDYIEVNTLNAKGNAWDFAIFRNDAPDVGVTISVGGAIVYFTNVNDTYMFAVGPNSKNISFPISENDRVVVLVQDIDIMFHDFIAKWNFDTKGKKDNVQYNYSKAGKNIKSCNLDFKIN